MKMFLPATALAVFALGACGEPTDTTAEPAVQEDNEFVEERTADEAPPTEATGATVSVTDEGVDVEADIPVDDNIDVRVDTDSN